MKVSNLGLSLQYWKGFEKHNTKWGCIHKTKTITINYGHLKGQKSNCQNEYEYQSLSCSTNGSN
jgi:hypothetical protein